MVVVVGWLLAVIALWLLVRRAGDRALRERADDHRRLMREIRRRPPG